MLIELLKTYDADVAEAILKDKDNPDLAALVKVWKKTARSKAGDVFKISDKVGKVLHDAGYARERRKVEFISALEHKGNRYEIGASRDFDVDLAAALVAANVCQYIK
jgi:hypothetical protein